MSCELTEIFLVLSVELYSPFGVVDVVCGDDCVVFFGHAGLSESNGAMVGGLHIPAECGTVETVVDLVQWMVVDVEAVEFSRGGG